MARPSWNVRGVQMQMEQFYEHATRTTLDALEIKTNGLQSQCKFKSPHAISWPSTMWSYKSNRQRKITWWFYRNCMWAVTSLPYQHWISSRDLSTKKLGILRTEMIFKLPRCLLLRVMCPLDLHELDGLVASLALGRVKNTDWTLWVGKVRT